VDDVQIVLDSNLGEIVLTDLAPEQSASQISREPLVYSNPSGSLVIWQSVQPISVKSAWYIMSGNKYSLDMHAGDEFRLTFACV
jgi:hypothetical protein